MTLLKRHKGEVSLLLAVSGLLVTAVLTATTDAAWLTVSRHGFEAATVGALADWLAVKMLFDEIKVGRLKIVPASGIIPRKQEAIARGAGKLVADEWLSKESIHSLLNRLDFAGLAVKELEKWRTGDGWKKAVEWLSRAVADWLERPEVRRRVNDLISDWSANMKVSEWCKKNLTPMDVERAMNAVVPVFSGSLLTALESDDVRELVLRRMKEEQKGFLKQLFFDPVETTDKAILQIKSFLKDIEHNPEHPVRQKISTAVYEWAQSPEFDGTIRGFARRLSDGTWLDEKLDEASNNLKSGEGPFRGRVEELASGILTEVENGLRSSARDGFNLAARKVIGDLLTEHHPKIAGLVEDNIRKRSKEDIREQFRSRTYDDMQWIRVNGAVVGFLIGCLFGSIYFVFS